MYTYMKNPFISDCESHFLTNGSVSNWINLSLELLIVNQILKESIVFAACIFVYEIINMIGDALFQNTLMEPQIE